MNGSISIIPTLCKLRYDPSVEFHIMAYCTLLTLSLDIYRIYPYKHPSLLITTTPSLPLQSSYFGVLHPSQQPTPLRFWDSEKRCVLIIPQLNTTYEK